MARRLRQQGVVVVQFIADRDGPVLQVGLVRGSGAEALDQAAQALVRNARLPPFPPDMPMSQQSVTVPIRYQLAW
jgi:protein TonB